MTIAPIRRANAAGTGCPPWCDSNHENKIGDTCVGEIERIRLVPSVWDRADAGERPTVYAVLQQNPGEEAVVAVDFNMAMEVLTAAEADEVADKLHALAASIRSAEAAR
jgi:hypothetical protein